MHLGDADFSDIYLSENMQAIFKTRRRGKTLLSAPPATLYDTLSDMHAECFERGQYERDFFVEHDGIRFRVGPLRDVNEQWYVARRLMWPLPALQDMPGLPRLVLRQLGILGQGDANGLVLLVGATGAGKTTTLFTLLKQYLISYGDVAVTIENPCELPMSGPWGENGRCFQIPVSRKGFERAMEEAMRMVPRYIVLGEIRSAESAYEAVKASINGHLVLATVHGPSITDGIVRVLSFAAQATDMVMAQTMMAQGLTAILHQRLGDSLRSGAGLRALDMSWLFFGNNPGLRSKIRTGRYQEIITDIGIQESKVKSGRLPLEEME